LVDLHHYWVEFTLKHILLGSELLDS